MKSPSKLSIAIGSFGIFLLIFNSVRYYWIYYDLSQLILGDLIGIGILAFAYVYNWMRGKDYDDARMQRQLDAIGAKVFNLDDEARRELGLGMERISS